MEMKGILLKGLVLLCISIFCASSVIAQEGEPETAPPLGNIPPGTAIIDNQRGSYSSPIELDNDCEGEFAIEVFTTNLVPNSNGQFILPQNADPIYLNYSILNITETMIPVVLFEHYGTNPETGLPVYSKIIYRSIDFSDACTAGEHVGGDDNPEFATAVFAGLSYELVDENGNPYPFYNNMGLGGIFYCPVFCDLPCDPEEEPTCENNWSGNLVVECKECEEYPLSPGGPDHTVVLPIDSFVGNDNGNLLNNDRAYGTDNLSSIENPELHNKTVNPSNSVKVSPNPVRSEMELLFSNEESEPIDIQIYDASGKIVFTQSSISDKGLNKINIQTNNWNEGIYFGKIESISNTQLFKIVKIR